MQSLAHHQFRFYSWALLPECKRCHRQQHGGHYAPHPKTKAQPATALLLENGGRVENWIVGCVSRWGEGACWSWLLWFGSSNNTSVRFAAGALLRAVTEMCGRLVLSFEKELWLSEGPKEHEDF